MCRGAVGVNVVDMDEGRVGRRGNDDRVTLGDDDPPAAHGAALGAGGVGGWWAWRNRRQTRDGVDSVSPATGRGTLHALLWFAGLAAIVAVGPLVVAWPRAVWFAIAVVVMVGVGLLWDRTHTS